ncbi:T9SS type A sorting domain-containing protein [Bacteroidota bacterium]
MKIKILILLSFFLFPKISLHTQGIPDCFCFPDLNEYYSAEYIPDSLWAFDTCAIGFTGNCDDIFTMASSNSSTFNWRKQLHAKEGWSLSFDDDQFPFSSIKMTFYTWEDISDNFSYFKQSFKAIEDTFGHYVLYNYRKYPDSLNYNDGFRLVFDNYVNICSVESTLVYIDSLYSWYNWIWESPNVEYLKYLNYDIKIYPNPTPDKINIIFKNEQIISSIKLFSLTGILLNSFKFENFTDKIELDLSDYPTGIYFLQTGDEFHKVVIIK